MSFESQSRSMQSLGSWGVCGDLVALVEGSMQRAKSDQHTDDRGCCKACWMLCGGLASGLQERMTFTTQESL